MPQIGRSIENSADTTGNFGEHGLIRPDQIWLTLSRVPPENRQKWLLNIKWEFEMCQVSGFFRRLSRNEVAAVFAGKSNG